MPNEARFSGVSTVLTKNHNHAIFLITIMKMLELLIQPLTQSIVVWHVSYPTASGTKFENISLCLPD
jgi:hypothetical protein